MQHVNASRPNTPYPWSNVFRPLFWRKNGAGTIRAARVVYFIVCLLAVCPGLIRAGEPASTNPAREIIDAVKIDQGKPLKALVVGKGAGKLAAELFHMQPRLRIYGVEPDQGACDAARRLVDSQGMYGKVTVAAGTTEHLAYAPLYFDMVVLDLTATKAVEQPIEALYRLLKPGGCAFLRVGPGRSRGWKKTMLHLGLEEAAIREAADGKTLVYARPGPSPAEDWGAWFRDAFHNCAVDIPGFKPPLVELWNYELEASDDRHNWVVPVASGGMVVYHYYMVGRVRAHDAFTGEPLWTRPSRFPSNIGVHKKVWMSVPATVGGTVLVATSLEELTCMDLWTGQTLWKKRLPEDIDWDRAADRISRSLRHLSVHKGAYYLLVNKDKALYYDPKTGKETVIKPVMPYHVYVKVGDLEFYPAQWNYSHRPMKWTVKKEGANKELYTFSSSGRPRFCIAEEENMLISMAWDPYQGFNLETGRCVWKGLSMAFTCSGPTYAGGYVWATASGVTYANDVRTGQTVWQIRNSNSCAPPVIAHGILYTISNNTERLRAYVSANLLKPPARRSK